MLMFKSFNLPFQDQRACLAQYGKTPQQYYQHDNCNIGNGISPLEIFVISVK